MNDEQRQLCLGLVVFPNGRRRLSREEFLRQFPSALESGRLAPKWLREARERHSPDEVSLALVIGFNFGFSPESREDLLCLAAEDWHGSHEDIVTALVDLPARDNVDALFRLTQWVPRSLAHDESRALAVKAIRALASLPGEEAERMLDILAGSDDETLRTNAVKQIGRRRSNA